MSAPNTYHDDVEARYLKIRAAFTLQGSSLNAWCQASGVHIQNARAALLGKWRGPKAELMVERIIAASGWVGE